MAHIRVGKSGLRVSWSNTRKSIRGSSLLRPQFDEFHTINSDQPSDSLQRLIAMHDPESRFLQAKYLCHVSDEMFEEVVRKFGIIQEELNLLFHTASSHESTTFVNLAKLIVGNKQRQDITLKTQSRVNWTSSSGSINVFRWVIIENEGRRVNVIIKRSRMKLFPFSACRIVFSDCIDERSTQTMAKAFFSRTDTLLEWNLPKIQCI